MTQKDTDTKTTTIGRSDFVDEHRLDESELSDLEASGTEEERHREKRYLKYRALQFLAAGKAVGVSMRLRISQRQRRL